MSETNILILNSGRRVELVKLFKKAMEDLKVSGKVIAADCSKLAPALYFADYSVILPRIDNPNYINSIIEECNKLNVRLVIPTIDTDLLLLAENRERIQSKTKARVLISDVEVIQTCRDKIKTSEYLQEHGFGTPKIYDSPYDVSEFPVFIKPSSGSSSIDSHIIYNKEGLNFYYNRIYKPIIQDYIQGDEYTVDVFLDFNSKVISIVPRLRIATRGGEILKGRIDKHKDIIQSVKSLMEILKPIGQITVQLIKTINEIKYIEINPRFGGGAPMSIMAGADSCKSIFRLLNGEEIQYSEDYTDELTFLRYDESLCIDKEGYAND